MLVNYGSRAKISTRLIYQGINNAFQLCHQKLLGKSLTLVVRGRLIYTA
jgi:hypothetical protein